MENLRKRKARILVVALLLGVLALPNVPGSTVKAASEEVAVQKVTAVNSLTGSKKIYLAKGKKATLKTTVTVTPNASENKEVTYKSSNKKVASVSNKGVIIGKKAGTARITVKSKKDSKKKAIVTVKVVKGKVNSIKLTKTSGTLTVGKTVKLKATVKTSAGGSKKVAWSSSNENVATVKNGTVKALNAGTATITAKAADGSGKKGTYKVTVKNAKKNASDVKALKKIIKSQRSLGANVPSLSKGNGTAYIWNKQGRLIEINLPKIILHGSLSIKGLSALTKLDCSWNDLTSLDVSNCKSLTTLNCYYNSTMSKLNVSGCKSLTTLDCSSNMLTSLDVSSCKSLAKLDCTYNRLSKLNVSGCKSLTTLDCSGNMLTSLDVRNCPLLTDLRYDRFKVTLIR